MNIYKHPQALVETKNIGEKTRVWAFAHILPEAQIGSDCNICDHVFIENDVVVGNRVTIKCGVQLWDGITIEDDVFIGPNATFINDPFPRSKKYPEQFSKTLIKKGASIGANATILAGKVIGQNALIGAGAVVDRDVPPNAIVTGNPANIRGYVNSVNNKQVLKFEKSIENIEPFRVSSVSGVKTYQMPIITDLRGCLSFAEYGKELPFLVKRYFLTFNVPSREVRGENAHKELHQFLVCIKGSCSIVVDDGQNREEIVLNTPEFGIYIPPMVWNIQYKYSTDAVLIVLASDTYDPDDYIRDYDVFFDAVTKK